MQDPGKPPSRWFQLLRTLLVWGLALWLGGFTFYSAAVIPILHDELGSPTDTGFVTQRVTDVLNVIGIVVVLLGCAGAVAERRWSRGRRAGTLPAILLLVASSICLAGLLVLHRVMDRALEAGSSPHFYTLHRAYLWLSVVQWAANLGLMACWSGIKEAAKSS